MIVEAATTAISLEIPTGDLQVTAFLCHTTSIPPAS